MAYSKVITTLYNGQPPPGSILGWHFLCNDASMAHGVGVTVQAGRAYRVDGPIEPCVRGLHGSVRALDALTYAPGTIICRTLHSGTVVRATDKLASSERAVLWMADAATTLHRFACWCARRALEREREAGREPDPRSWAAVEVKERWLEGTATDAELASACTEAAAAWSAAEAGVAWSAAEAARAAARAAGAAWSAAVAAEAARTAEVVEAAEAERGAQNQQLEMLLHTLAPAGYRDPVV